MDDSGYSRFAMYCAHRGFNTKARGVLIGNCDTHLPGHEHCALGTMRSNSDQNLRHRCIPSFLRRNSQNNSQNTSQNNCQSNNNTNNNTSNGNQTPKSVSSNTSITEVPKEAPQFDSIGEAPVVKNHKKLGQIGKTVSCVELKEKNVGSLNTYEDDNVLKLPSIDSDSENLAASRSGKYENADEGLGKFLGKKASRSSKYMVKEENKEEAKAKGANNWLKK